MERDHGQNEFKTVILCESPPSSSIFKSLISTPWTEAAAAYPTERHCPSADKRISTGLGAVPVPPRVVGSSDTRVCFPPDPVDAVACKRRGLVGIDINNLIVDRANPARPKTRSLFTLDSHLEPAIPLNRAFPHRICFCGVLLDSANESAYGRQIYFIQKSRLGGRSRRRKGAARKKGAEGSKS